MKLRMVTFTGADESVNPRELLNEVVYPYPYVELGLLVSPKHTLKGGEQCPSLAWIDSLNDEIQNFPYDNLRCCLALHVCSDWCRDFVQGGDRLLNVMQERINYFGRIQLNFKASDSNPNPMAFAQQLKKLRNKPEVIVQVLDENIEFAYALKQLWPRTSVLFDESRGKGVLPKNRRTPLNGLVCGYAGGIGPDNILSEIGKIQQAVPQDYDETWIDMQGKVRSEDKKCFEIRKIIPCLEQAKPFMKQIKFPTFFESIEGMFPTSEMAKGQNSGSSQQPERGSL
jgi:hypothetical protein